MRDSLVLRSIGDIGDDSHPIFSKDRILNIKGWLSKVLGKRSIPLAQIAPLLPDMSPVQLHDALQWHVKGPSAKMMFCRIAGGRPIAGIDANDPPSLKAQPARYVAEMWMFFMVMMVVLAVVGYFEGHPFMDMLILLGCVLIMAIAYGTLLLGVTNMFFDDCCRFLKTVATDAVK
ncbi:MAG: hypothetical protein ACJAXG_001456 [Celeribacter sp.]|jgi:hypothetical protein